MEKDTAGETTVEVSISYYEIYNDRVYDLFEPPEKRTPAGLPIRDNGGKTVVVGLTERPCTTLKDFEQLYDQANLNRSTSATKLNAHSSRSHAILCVKVTQITGDEMRISTASAIDLAGSEDNRRTDNGKERMVESASINKSLFVLAQCVEAISKKQARIPYRESRMTRILSLGQNNGLTVMILNLAPVRSYHLDTLSSLNFANRTKKIEVNEIENLPIFRAASKIDHKVLASTGPSMHRQPLRPKNFSANIIPVEPATKTDKAVKTFAVFSDKAKSAVTRPNVMAGQGHKRPSSEAIPTLGRPSKIMRPSDASSKTNRPVTEAMTQESIEALIERKVNEKLAESALNANLPKASTQELSSEVQARLDALERRIGGQETERSEGLQYLLMAKQHQVRGEDSSALKMYQLALPFFPENEKLNRKMLALQDKVRRRTAEKRSSALGGVALPEADNVIAGRKNTQEKNTLKEPEDGDDDYQEEEAAGEGNSEDENSGLNCRKKARKPQSHGLQVFRDIAAASLDDEDENADPEDELAHVLAVSIHPQQTPRTKSLLRIINSRDVSQIRLLKGVGAKKAEAIVNCLCELDDEAAVRDLGQLGRLRGVGLKGVEKMREGLVDVF